MKSVNSNNNINNNNNNNDNDYINAVNQEQILANSKSRVATVLTLIPSFVVKQNNINDPYRMVRDFRRVNRLTIRDACPTKQVNMIINEIILSVPMKIGTVVDAKGGFYQLEVAPESRMYTTIVNQLGTFQHNYMGFGCVNSPSVCQREIDNTFKDIHEEIKGFFKNYVNDFFIFSKSVEDHISTLKLWGLLQYSIKNDNNNNNNIHTINGIKKKNHLKYCETCQFVDRKYGTIDFLGPFTKSTDGNQYILTIIDKFTGWVEAFATPDRKAESVAIILCNEIISRYGAPQRLFSDNAADFLAEMISRLFASFGIKKLNTSTYHPQTNGKCEHFNGFLLRMTRKYVENYGSWDRQIHSLLFIVRTTVNTTTGYSPFYENQLITPPSDNLIIEFRNNLIKAYHETKLNHTNYQERQEIYGNKNRKPLKEFKEGDLVLVEGLETKDGCDDEEEEVENIKRTPYGPFKITRVNGNGAYNIDAPDNFLQRINVSRMKLFYKK
ncbi:hypothetical protein ACTA71_002462 [Dictyostelium dimigraforme]